MPTVGFKVEQFTKNNIAFTMFDMSGASTHRDLWTAYYGECDAVIYVVDCKDKLRICVAKKELDDMLANPGASPPPRGTRRRARRHARSLARSPCPRLRAHSRRDAGRAEGSPDPVPVLRQQIRHCWLVRNRPREPWQPP